MTTYYPGKYAFRTMQPIQFVLLVKPDAAVNTLAFFRDIQSLLPLTSDETLFSASYMGFTPYMTSMLTQLQTDGHARVMQDVFATNYTCEDRTGEAFGYQQGLLLGRQQTLRFLDPNAHLNTSFYNNLNEAWRQTGWHLWFGDADWLYTLPDAPSIACQWAPAETGSTPLPAGMRITCTWNSRTLPQPWPCRALIP